MLPREVPSSPVPFFTLQDLRLELQAHGSSVQHDVANLLSPLRQDINSEVRCFGTLLQRELSVLRDDLKGNRNGHKELCHSDSVISVSQNVDSGDSQQPHEAKKASHVTFKPPNPPLDNGNGCQTSKPSEKYPGSSENNAAKEASLKQAWVNIDADFEEVTKLEESLVPAVVPKSVTKEGWTSVLPLPGQIAPGHQMQKTASADDVETRSMVQALSDRSATGISTVSKKARPKPKGTISSHKSGKRDERFTRGNSGLTYLLTHSSVTQRLQMKCMKIVSHLYFDYAITLLILANGIIVGVQTDWMARNLQEEAPLPFQVLEWIFGVVFTVEIALRLFAYRCAFFYVSGKGWNIFDFTVVFLQWFEILLELMAAGFGVDFSLLRILRLLRVIRLARTLRLIGELRTIVSSIAGSMKSLFWTGVLLFMIIYVLGVGFTQVVLNKRIKFDKDGYTIPESLDTFWGDLVASCFSLFESITGGVDWDDVARPLIVHVGAEWGIVFSFFIMFTVFAMLNVVTGVFIESVMKNASIENEMRTASHVQSLFRSLDCDCHGEISWEDFEKALQTKEMREFFRTIDVDIANARSLFDLLDLDESGCVNGDEFVDGCLRIWAPTKGMDLRMIHRDVNKLSRIIRAASGLPATTHDAPLYHSQGSHVPRLHQVAETTYTSQQTYDRLPETTAMSGQLNNQGCSNPDGQDVSPSSKG